MILSLASNVFATTPQAVHADLSNKVISLKDIFARLPNVEFDAYFDKKKDSQYLEIKKFLAYGETKTDQKPRAAKPASAAEDVPF